VELEAGILEDAEPSGVAPRFLAEVEGAWHQEGLSGRPLVVEPLEPADAASLAWRPAHQATVEGLARLGRVTVRPTRPEDPPGLLERAISHGPISERARTRLAEAVERVSAIDASVLRHGDCGPQNVHIEDDRLVGLVDWELARRGAPGFDIWLAAASLIEQGVGLRRWSQDRVVEAFRGAWTRSEFGARARAAARAAAIEAGVADADVDSLELTFFGRRLGARLARPQGHATNAWTAARILEVVALG
jgi:hypothetical protein